MFDLTSYFILMKIITASQNGEYPALAPTSQSLLNTSRLLLLTHIGSYFLWNLLQVQTPILQGLLLLFPLPLLPLHANVCSVLLPLSPLSHKQCPLLPPPLLLYHPLKSTPIYILQTLLRLTIIILIPLLLYHCSLPPMWKNLLLPLLLNFLINCCTPLLIKVNVKQCLNNLSRSSST